MEVPAGQVNFKGSLPRSENNGLQPMLHPVWQKYPTYDTVIIYLYARDVLSELSTIYEDGEIHTCSQSKSFWMVVGESMNSTISICKLE